MKKDKNKLFITAEMMLTMLGAIAGVGFVSGTEIEDFFARFQIDLIFGILFLFILLAFLIYRVLTQNINCQNLFKLQNMSNKLPNNTTLVKFKIRNIILFFNLLMLSSAMFSGLRVLLYNLLKHNYIFPYLGIILSVFFMVILGIKGLAKFNYLVIIFLIFVISFLVKDLNININLASSGFDIKNSFASIAFAGIYVFMNIVELEPVVREYGLVLNKKNRITFSIVFSFIISALIFLICLFLNSNRRYTNFDMPLLVYFGEKNVIYKGIYYTGLLIALLSTLLTCLIGVKRRVLNTLCIKQNVGASFVSVLMCVIVGILPFSFFAKTIYPIIGILNFIMFVFL